MPTERDGEQRRPPMPPGAPRGVSLEQLASLAVTSSIVAGAGLISYGAQLVYHPLGFIVAGGFLLAGGWQFARRGV